MARTDEDNSENGNAIGLLFTYGKFRMVDLADLTWNREIELNVPNNPIGFVDLFMVSHHGNNLELARAGRRAALAGGAHGTMAPERSEPLRIGSSCGRRRGCRLSICRTIRQWQAENPPEEFIANIVQDGKPADGKCSRCRWTRMPTSP